MRIDCINPYKYTVSAIKPNNVTFGDCKDWFTDDEPDYWGNEERHSMRSKMYQDIFGAGIHRETDNETNNAKTLFDVYILNFHSLGNSSYSGECLANKPDYFKLLKASGVKRIIDLIDKPEVKQACEEYNLEYYFYDMNVKYGTYSIFQDMKQLIKQKKEELYKQGLSKIDFDNAIKDYINTVGEENTQYVRGLKKLIDIVNEGCFYMSCQYGYRTENCLSLATLFNPSWRGPRLAPTKEFVQRIENMFKNLTAEHKEILGIDEEYSAYLKKFISKFVHENSRSITTGLH